MLYCNNNHLCLKWLKMLTSLFLLAMLSACAQVLFQPQRTQFATPERLGVIYENVQLETHDGLKLHGWKLLSKDVHKGTILFFQGNGENISTYFANVYWLTDHGYDVYLFDYRGYGKSEGAPQLDAVIRDVETTIGYSVKQLAKNEHLIVMGYSLGASLAIHAVAHSQHKESIKTLITVEAFSDYRQVTQDVLSTSWLTWLLQWPLSSAMDNSYRPLDAVTKIAPIPLMLMHSKEDEIIPFEHALALYEAANEPKKLQVVTGTHNRIFNEIENRQLLLDYLTALTLSDVRKYYF